MKVGGYEIVGLLVDAKPLAPRVHIARDAAGELVELVELAPNVDDIEHAYFTGDDVPMWRDVAALRDVRLPRLCAPPVRHDGHDWLPCAYTPSLSAAELFAAARDNGGLAVPLVVAFVDDVARALLRLHEARFVHGTLITESLAITLDGTARIVSLGPRMWGVADIVDVPALGAVAFQLLCGVPFDARDELHLLELRPDLPPELAAWIDEMIEPAARKRARLVDVIDHFVESVLWAVWTREQVAAELRALLPKRVDDVMTLR